MSRIGKLPVSFPAEIKIEQQGDILVVSGPKGQLQEKIHPDMKLGPVVRCHKPIPVGGFRPILL